MKTFTIFHRMILFLFALHLFVCTAKEYEVHYMNNGQDPKDFVKNKINSHEVMVFARSYGKHNQQVKDLLTQLQKSIDVQIEFLDVDLMEGFDSSLVLIELQQITGQWTLPNIFIGKKHVGGNTELDQMHAIGELETMLREAGNEL